MSDEGAHPYAMHSASWTCSQAARSTYEFDGQGARLVRFADENHEVFEYTYNDEARVVRVWAADGSMTAFQVPVGYVLARVRHPETGAWVHACVKAPAPTLESGEALAWPTRIVPMTAASPMVARQVESRPPTKPPIRSITTYTYDAEGKVSIDDGRGW